MTQKKLRQKEENSIFLCMVKNYSIIFKRSKIVAHYVFQFFKIPIMPPGPRSLFRNSVVVIITVHSGTILGDVDSVRRIHNAPG